jgi:hypothetical protein
MNKSKSQLGKIFLSHSSLDKTFVRRLSTRLKKEGYDVWLDEKELLPGDKLSTKLSDAIELSKVILIVISENSLNSKWLQFELELATRKMVEEGLRLIPILIGNVEIPHQLKNIIYVDFKPGKKSGYKVLLKALEAEIPQNDDNISFREQIENILEKQFDGRSSLVMFNDNKAYRYNYVKIENVKGFDDNLKVPYVVIPSWFLGSLDLYDSPIREEFQFKNENISERYFLLIYERSESFVQRNDYKERIIFKDLESSYLDFEQFEVKVDLTGLVNEVNQAAIIYEAKKMIVEHFAKQLST